MRPPLSVGVATRSRRLKRRADFVRVQTRGLRVNAGHFLLLVAARSEPGPSRFGIVASKRIGGAVERARAKRLVREAMRALPALLPDEAPGPIDLVVIVRDGAPSLKLADLLSELGRATRHVLRRASELSR